MRTIITVFLLVQYFVECQSQSTVFCLSTTKKDFSNARNSCEAKGGDLLLIKSQAFQEDVLDAFMDSTLSENRLFYFGLQNVGTSWRQEWKHLDGTPLGTWKPWWTGSGATSGPCGVYHWYSGTSHWDKMSCGNTRYFICQFPAGFADCISGKTLYLCGTTNVLMGNCMVHDVSTTTIPSTTRTVKETSTAVASTTPTVQETTPVGSTAPTVDETTIETSTTPTVSEITTAASTTKTVSETTTVSSTTPTVSETTTIATNTMTVDETKTVGNCTQADETSTTVNTTLTVRETVSLASTAPTIPGISMIGRNTPTVPENISNASTTLTVLETRSSVAVTVTPATNMNAASVPGEEATMADSSLSLTTSSITPHFGTDANPWSSEQNEQPWTSADVPDNDTGSKLTSDILADSTTSTSQDNATRLPSNKPPTRSQLEDPDSRLSAKLLGYMSLCLVALASLLLIVLDIPLYLRQFRAMMADVMSCFKGCCRRKPRDAYVKRKRQQVFYIAYQKQP